MSWHIDEPKVEAHMAMTDGLAAECRELGLKPQARCLRPFGAFLGPIALALLLGVLATAGLADDTDD